MDVPPSRYRVIERGRRLIVVDTRTGMPVSGVEDRQRERLARLAESLEVAAPRDLSRPAAAPTPRPASPVAPGTDPRILTTRPWYDDKAPRRVRLVQSGGGPLSWALIFVIVILVAVWLGFGWPGLIVAGFLLAQKASRAQFRKVATRWLDGMEQV